MTAFGYTLSSEEHPPRQLVQLARRAEEVGFDFLTISDHFHPWTTEQGHSPFVWSVLGAVAGATERVRVGTGVTCPILRVHPAIVAHAAATTAQLFEGRFFLGVGTGEALNEHILGQRWPAVEIRHEMLDEAVAVMRDALDRRGRRPPRDPLHRRERPALRPARGAHPDRRLGVRPEGREGRGGDR